MDKISSETPVLSKAEAQKLRNAGFSNVTRATFTQHAELYDALYQTVGPSLHDAPRIDNNKLKLSHQVPTLLIGEHSRAEAAFTDEGNAIIMSQKLHDLLTPDERVALLAGMVENRLQGCYAHGLRDLNIAGGFAGGVLGGGAAALAAAVIAHNTKNKYPSRRQFLGGTAAAVVTSGAAGAVISNAIAKNTPEPILDIDREALESAVTKVAESNAERAPARAAR